ncbi:gag-pol polyprotein [Tanacetum coccineum]
MTTLAKYMIVADAENRLPMLDNLMYNSWEIHMLLYIKGKKNGRMMLESIENGPLVYPTVEENVSQTDIWERIKLLMKGTELSYQERKCKLYNEFDKFSSVKAKSLHEYYLRFDQLINDMHTIGMTMQQDLAVPIISTEGDDHNCLSKTTSMNILLTGDKVKSFSGTEEQKEMQQPLGGSRGNNVTGQARIVKCYNCQGEGHMARQCTNPKRPRNSVWFKEKMLLVQAQESGQVLDEEQLSFLTDPRVIDGQDIQTIITHNAPFQTNDLDAYDSDCDDISSSKVVLMANLLSYGSDVLFEVPQHETYQNDNMLNQSVQQTQYFEQSLIDYVPDNEITSDNNIISYEQYLQQMQNVSVQDTNSFAQQDAMIIDFDVRGRESIKMLAKQNDPISKENKINISPINYSKLNKLTDDFGKYFVPQKELSAEQAFRLQFSNPISEQPDDQITPVRMEAPSELLKCAVDKKYFDIQKKEIFLNNDRLLEDIICQDVMNIVMHADFVPVNVLPANNKCLVHDNLEIERLEQENDHLFSSTSASRSQPSGNTKNNTISQTTSSNQKNKVEDHSRSVQSNSNKKNRVSEPVYNANVKHTMLNATSELIYVKCNQCMFDANHGLCYLKFVNDVNVRSKSKSVKSSKRQNTWKPTSKIFTDIGYRWKLTGWTFTIVENTYPLTRITSTKVEPLKENTSKSLITPNPEIKIYRRKTKVAKLIDLHSEPSILGSRPSNISKPNKH